MNLSRGDPDGHRLLNGKVDDGIPTDGIASLQTRRSMQARRSLDHRRMSSGSGSYGSRGDRQGLIHSYDEENGELGLNDLLEDSEGEVDKSRSSFGGLNGHPQPPKIYNR